MGLDIRKATVDDLNRLVELSLDLQLCMEKSNPRVWMITDEGKRTGLRKETEEMLLDAEGRLMVAVREGSIVGFAFGKVSRRTTHSPSVVGHISRVYIIEQLRRRGIGMRLVEALYGFFHSEGVQEVTLRYVVGNTSAEHFWTKLGFRPVLTTALTSIGELRETLANEQNTIPVEGRGRLG